ncbi:MAG: urocanate hydratase [Flavobacteriaceae bacterium]|nr:urocanate hydratase [Flavobacteriaceae bacterium]MCI5089233.1 urocanate hydratase [Flavobacteriaceae bacterium]
MTKLDIQRFRSEIQLGLNGPLPPKPTYKKGLPRAPKRQDLLSKEEKELALRNALRYFPEKWHAELATEFAQELLDYGRIYMYRFKPSYPIYARPITHYPAKTKAAAAIMLMIDNNLDPAVAQHPEELITYGGNGAVFQNWAQYKCCMKFLSEMEEDQTLHLYSGHPMGLFPSSKNAPRVVVTNGMVIPNYSSAHELERMNALGVSQYGQMTAGSFMYIGPQGIVHGTTITLMNAFRKKLGPKADPRGHIFLTAGLGGMSGAQPKAGNIVGCISICAEVNPAAAYKRHEQAWVDLVVEDLDHLITRTQEAQRKKEVISIAYVGNVIEVWEAFYKAQIKVTLGSDQTSLHNPWAGGYYPEGLTYEAANALMVTDPEAFKKAVQNSLRKQLKLIDQHTARGTYFFDYGNAFLLEASRAHAPVMAKNGIDFKYPSYVQDILGPLCFDYGFGPFRWVCTSGKASDLAKTDAIALSVMKALQKDAPQEIAQQLQDNCDWIAAADDNQLVVGSQARILYADTQGRIAIAAAFNKAIASGEITAAIVLGRDHHDVSGTDSPYRETSNIYDGSKFTADMAIHNVIGDSFRGASWVSIHNGGGVGWGEVINGGFGLVLDGSKRAGKQLESMLFYDVSNGLARRSWARNAPAISTTKRLMAQHPKLKLTTVHLAADEVLKNHF